MFDVFDTYMDALNYCGLARARPHILLNRAGILLLIDHRFRSYLIGRGSAGHTKYHMPKFTLNRTARVFSVCGYSRGFRHGHAVNIVLIDRKRFENAYTCKIY